MSFVCREAIREFQADRVTVTTKKGSRGDCAIDETTERREPKNLQCLKIIVQALKVGVALTTNTNPKRQRGTSSAAGSTLTPEPGTLNSTRPDDPYYIDAPSDEMRRIKVEDWICTERAKRKRQPDGNIDLDCIEAKDLVSALIGEPHTGEALEKIANDSGKALVDKVGWAPPTDQSGADISVCHDRETAGRSDGPKDVANDVDPTLPPPPPLSVPPSAAPPPTKTATITTSASSATSPQLSPPKRLPPKPAPAIIVRWAPHTV